MGRVLHRHKLPKALPTPFRFLAAPLETTLEFAPGRTDVLEAQLAEAAKAGRAVELDLDVRERLDIEDVRVLIRLLRRAHELGTDLKLRTNNVEHRRVLGLTALDRLFTIRPNS
jgi:anti-anti-sigma regulatory factor